tara:strand:- start:645 stop:800 length:156 start_codon:yes stop_codon:yes gene_type:complete
MKIFRAILSLIFPGLGQLVDGQLWAAFCWLIVGIVIPGVGHVGSAVHALID